MWVGWAPVDLLLVAGSGRVCSGCHCNFFMGVKVCKKSVSHPPPINFGTFCKLPFQSFVLCM